MRRQAVFLETEVLVGRRQMCCKDLGSYDRWMDRGNEIWEDRNAKSGVYI